MSSTHLNRITRQDFPDLMSRAKPGIVHLGVGAFYKAHQAVYTHNAMQQCGGDWGIIGVSLRSPIVSQQLNPQDGVYTLVTTGAESNDGVSSQVVGALQTVLVAPEDPQAVIDAMCLPSVKVVTLTITEKGYYCDLASGELQRDNDDIAHDIANLSAPKTAIGYLVAAIQARHQAKLSPLTILSCDNLPLNGQLLRHLVSRFASEIDADLAKVIAAEYTFPCSMVDRIVPAMVEEKRQATCAELGYDDQALIITETFSQWVIEDNFVNGRPDWDKVGAIFVTDVHAFETMKLRLLNGSHSAIAYIGYLSGCETVADAVADADIHAFISQLMTYELRPSVNVGDGIDLGDYCELLLNRFANVALQHKTYQIAMDGSQKLPQRLLGSLQHQIKTGGSYSHICFVIAAWMAYTSGQTLDGQAILVQDPMAQPLQQAFTASQGDPKQWVKRTLAMSQIFAPQLAQNHAVVACIIEHLTRILAADRASDAIVLMME